MIDSILQHYNSAVCFYQNHKVLSWVIMIEAFPVYVTVMHLLKIYIDRTIKKCVHNKTMENKVASKLYFFKDLGPNTASFSVVTLIVDIGKDDELKPSTVFMLTIIFFVGIMLKEKSRKYTNLFYKRLEELRSSKWEQSSEY